MLFGLSSNGFIGDPCNYVQMVVIIYGTASNVGYSGFDLIGLLVGNEMCALSGHECCTTGPMGQCRPYREGFKGSSKPYGVYILMDYE
jgi:hypothetical protein